MAVVEDVLEAWGIIWSENQGKSWSYRSSPEGLVSHVDRRGIAAQMVCGHYGARYVTGLVEDPAKNPQKDWTREKSDFMAIVSDIKHSLLLMEKAFFAGSITAGLLLLTVEFMGAIRNLLTVFRRSLGRIVVGNVGQDTVRVSARDREDATLAFDAVTALAQRNKEVGVQFENKFALQTQIRMAEIIKVFLLCMIRSGRMLEDKS